MRVGVPKEIKDHEDRVGLVPSSVASSSPFTALLMPSSTTCEPGMAKVARISAACTSTAPMASRQGKSLRFSDRAQAMAMMTQIPSAD